MVKSLLNDRAVIPFFHLLGREGQDFDSSSFKRKKNLVLFFLTHPQKEALRRFIQAQDEEKVTALFMTDKFGELFFQCVVCETADLPPMEDIVRSLVFIESQCLEWPGG